MGDILIVIRGHSWQYCNTLFLFLPEILIKHINQVFSLVHYILLHLHHLLFELRVDVLNIILISFCILKKLKKKENLPQFRNRRYRHRCHRR